MAPNISKTKFIRKANNVDVSEVQGYKHKMSAVPYLNRLPEVIFCIDLIIAFVLLKVENIVDIAYFIFLIVYLVYLFIRLVIHYPRIYISFRENTVYYCNGKRLTSFQIDDIDSISFHKYDKTEKLNLLFRRRWGLGYRLRYRYIVLSFRTKVLECQRLNFINELFNLSVRLKGLQPYTYELELDIFNFEYPHEVFALLSQNVYVPVY